MTKTREIVTDPQGVILEEETPAMEIMATAATVATTEVMKITEITEMTEIMGITLITVTTEMETTQVQGQTATATTLRQISITGKEETTRVLTTEMQEIQGQKVNTVK